MNSICRTKIVAALAVAVMASSCQILDEKTLEVILKSETCAEFSQDSESEDFTDVATIDMQEELEDALTNNGYEKSDIDDATLVGAFVGVTSFAQAHDWIISGQIEVEYLTITDAGDTTVVSGPVTLINYTSQSVQDALGQKLPVPLTDPGVALLQQALDQFLADTLPPTERCVLRFTVNNGTARNPQGDPPSQTDPIVFDWKAWLVIHVLITQQVEVPDPFGG